MDIRSIIEYKIKAAGITKRELCNRCGIQHANNINTMLAAPSWPTLEKMAAALGMSVAELVTDNSTDERESESKPVFSIITCPYCRRELKLTKAEDEPNPNRSDASS